MHTPPRCIINEYRFEKDTFFNSNTYHKIIKTEIDRTTSLGCGFPPLATITNSTFGFIRNDSLNKLLWLRLPNSNTDTLFYDFDLTIGDTLSNFYMTDNSYIQVVDSVDTVLLGNRYRKKFYISSICGPNEIDFLIEGIGANTGFAFNLGSSCALAGSINKLECHGDSTATIYIGQNSSCVLTSTSVEVNETSAINLIASPNPSSGSFNINTKLEINRIELYSIQGKKLDELDTQQTKWSLPKSDGIYLLRIETSSGQIITKKLIKR
jgi:hypothetical protein